MFFSLIQGKLQVHVNINVEPFGEIFYMNPHCIKIEQAVTDVMAFSPNVTIPMSKK